MVEIGKYNTLKIIKDLDFGVYLDGGDGMEILLPVGLFDDGAGCDGNTFQHYIVG